MYTWGRNCVYRAKLSIAMAFAAERDQLKGHFPLPQTELQNVSFKESLRLHSYSLHVYVALYGLYATASPVLW